MCINDYMWVTMCHISRAMYWKSMYAFESDHNQKRSKDADIAVAILLWILLWEVSLILKMSEATESIIFKELKCWRL